jgi:hypothetical protein
MASGLVSKQAVLDVSTGSEGLVLDASTGSEGLVLDVSTGLVELHHQEQS